MGYTANCGTVQLFGVLPTAAQSAAEAVGRALERGCFPIHCAAGRLWKARVE